MLGFGAALDNGLSEFPRTMNSHTTTKANTITAASTMPSDVMHQLIHFLKKWNIFTFDDHNQTYHCSFREVEYGLAGGVMIFVVNIIVDNWVCKGIRDMRDFQTTFGMSLEDVVAMVRRQVEETLRVMLANQHSYVGSGRENV
ncbi:hypothetical protein BGX38DRAFT_1327975 [Terfezia claveryi]|nr:hypothetical protein BGX38DRAFT_1327975 [Terfezia claveryi]